MWARAAARDEAMEVAVEIQKGQAGFKQEQVQLDFSDDSTDDAGNNDKSKLEEDYILTTSMSGNQGCKSLLSIRGIISNFTPILPYFQHLGEDEP